MRLLKLIALLFCISTQLSAQIHPERPSGQPGKPVLPDPKIIVRPADLLVTNIAFVSIVSNPTTKTYMIGVNVTVKNNGGFGSPNTKLEAFFSTPASSTAWRGIPALVNIPAIAPGQSYSADCYFKEYDKTIGAVPFGLKVKADASSLVAESDETNNFSASIVIDPRAH